MYHTQAAQHMVSNPEDVFDLVVLGGGSGGSACARRAAGYGAKVAIVEKGPTRDEDGKRTGAGFGGTCVNVGCVPKKVMWTCANMREQMLGLAPSLGLSVPASAGEFDWPALVAKRNAYVAGLNKSYETNWTKAGIEVVVGEASFADGETVHVKGSDGTVRTLKAKRTLVAVGGVPATLGVPGDELAISSDGFFDLPQLPKKVAVIGGGYIAVELAGILHGLGAETHLFFRGETVLQRGFDKYIVSALMAELAAHGPSLHKRSTPQRLFKAADGTTTLCVVDAAGALQEHGGFDCVLVAVGRTPCTASLGLANAGVDVASKSGHIVVDGFETTSNPNVLAIGDVTTTGYELTPVAIAAGRRLADRLFGGEPRARIEYSTIATVVFSHPPIGCIGLTEEAARAEYGDAAIVVKQASFASMTYAMCDSPEQKVRTSLKLVLRLPEETVVGLHCIGPSSDEMIQGFAVAVRMGATRRDFEASVAIHPTIAEEFVTFGGWGQVKEADSGKLRPQLPPYITDPPKKWPSTKALLGVGAVAAVLSAAVTTLTCVGNGRKK